jgi:transposase InsO family protein
MSQRRNWSEIEEVVRKIQENGLSYRAGAKQYGIKVSVLYEYNKRLKRLEKEKSKTSSSTNSSTTKPRENTSIQPQLPQEVEDLIIRYRKDHPDYGYGKIEHFLRDQHFLYVPQKKIRQVLKSRDLHRSCDSAFDQVKSSEKGSRRFEAAYPKELYQMDIMYVYIKNLSVSYLVTIIDDHSRFIVNSELRHDQKGESMIEVLHRGINRYGQPKRLLTDQSGSFYTWSQSQTIFQTYLEDMKIEHIVADPHSPQTLGKLERWHQTIQKELIRSVPTFQSYRHARDAIADYINDYNYHRPHQGIGGACPADRFHGIEGETKVIESELLDKNLDLTKGYLIFKSSNHSICVGYSSQGVRLFLNGKLLKP